MATCGNGHDQPDIARFCGICGVAMADFEEVVGDETSIDLDVLESDEEDESEDSEIDDDAEDTASDEELPDDDELDFDPDSSDEDDDDGSSFTFGRSVPADVTQVLKDWAEEHGERDDPYIQGLLEAIDRRDDLTMWASLNPLETLPQPRPLVGRNLTSAASISTLIRNVLIFVPVLLTWLSIGRAVGAYSEYLRRVNEKDILLQEGSDPTTFIAFWYRPEPADLLSDFWTIGDVARHVGILIASIIGFTLLSGLLSARASSARDSAIIGLDRDRLRVALAVSKALHGKRQATPESIGEALAAALGDLTVAARDVNDAAIRLTETSTGIAALNPHIESLNENALEFFNQTGPQTVASIRELVNSIAELRQSVSGDIKALFSEAAISIEEASKQLAKTNASVEYGTKQLRDDLEAIHGRLQGLIAGGRR